MDGLLGLADFPGWWRRYIVERWLFHVGKVAIGNEFVAKRARGERAVFSAYGG
jgi:hypothetical protein